MKKFFILATAYLLITSYHALNLFLDSERILLSLEKTRQGEKILRWIDGIMIEAIFIYGLRW
jgi:hypothetical protein